MGLGSSVERVTGHMKTNKQCPKYSEPDAQEYDKDGMQIQGGYVWFRKRCSCGAAGTQIKLTASKVETARTKATEAANPTLKIDMSRVMLRISLLFP